MQDMQLIALVLGAVLVGAVIPVLFQLRATLRAAEAALKGTVPRVERTLDETSKLVADAAQVLERMQSATRVLGALGAAIGPAIVAGFSSYRSTHRASDEETEQEEDEHEQRARVSDRV
jgi:uncharacterized protein YoxC